MNAMGIIFANIYDSSLGELTNKRTMASLPYGGRYRQIDFTLSNMSNSGIRHIGIISRYNYQSLMNHIGSGQEWDLELEEFGLEFLTPNSSTDVSVSVRGKLEALYASIDYLELANVDYVILADSGVLCNMDMNALLECHIASGKDMTVAAKAGIANGKKQLDLALKLNSKGEVSDLAVDYQADKSYLAGMDIYVIGREKLVSLVRESVARNLYKLERDMIMKQYYDKKLTVGVYQFPGVAMFNESTLEYYQNSMALAKKEIRADLFHGAHTIYTKVRDQVPSYYGENADINECVVADGCMIDGSVTGSVLFRQVTIEEGAQVQNCVLMNDCTIGAGSEVRYAILDKDVVVRPGAKLIGTPDNPVIVKRGDIV